MANVLVHYTHYTALLTLRQLHLPMAGCVIPAAEAATAGATARTGLLQTAWRSRVWSFKFYFVAVDLFCEFFVAAVR